MESNPNTLKSFLPIIIKAQNMNVTEFCKKLNVTRALYYQYLHDKSRPSFTMVNKIADVLQCSPKEILEHVQPRKKFYHRSVNSLQDKELTQV